MNLSSPPVLRPTDDKDAKGELKLSDIWKKWFGDAAGAIITLLALNTGAVGYTVSTLPAAGVVGRRAWVTDALAPTALSTVVGGGAVKVPVFDNGIHWVVG